MGAHDLEELGRKGREGGSEVVAPKVGADLWGGKEREGGEGRERSVRIMFRRGK